MAPNLSREQLEARGIRQVLRKPTTVESINEAVGRTVGTMETAGRADS